MDAAIDVFSESGFAGASLEEICHRGDLTRGAFYYNFESKEQLFLAVMQREFESTLEVASTAAVPGEIDLAEVIQLVSTLYSNQKRDHVTWALLNDEFRLHAMRDADAAVAFTAHSKMINERLGALITAAAHNYRRRLTAPAETIGSIAIAVFVQAVSEGLLARLDNDAIRELAMSRVTVAMEGLLPRIGA
jgi:AcrR family transcriptional regulator